MLFSQTALAAPDDTGAVLDDTLAGLDFQPSCQTRRCAAAPNPASTIMTVSPPTCGCRMPYVICTPCVDYFWKAKASRTMACTEHPVTFTWAEVTSFTPLLPTTTQPGTS